MVCPNCGLVNPDTATVCDCGYDLELGRLTAEGCKRKEAALSRYRHDGCAWGCLSGGIGAFLGGSVGFLVALPGVQRMAGASESAIGALLVAMLLGAAIGLGAGVPLGLLLRARWWEARRAGRR
jgi:hypothetical protein